VILLSIIFTEQARCVLDNSQKDRFIQKAVLLRTDYSITYEGRGSNTDRSIRTSRLPINFRPFATTGTRCAYHEL